MTDEPDPKNRPFNLWAPVPGDHGAHGTFGARSSKRSPWTWLNTRHSWIAGGLPLAGAGVVAAPRPT